MIVKHIDLGAWPRLRSLEPGQCYQVYAFRQDRGGQYQLSDGCWYHRSHFEVMEDVEVNAPVNTSALSTQVGGDHYKQYKIQPVEYISANNIPFIEGNVIKYVTRWRSKAGIPDLEKAKHMIDILIDLEKKATA